MTLEDAIDRAQALWPITGTAWREDPIGGMPERFYVGVTEPGKNPPSKRVYGAGWSFEEAFTDATKQGH